MHAKTVCFEPFRVQDCMSAQGFPQSLQSLLKSVHTFFVGEVEDTVTCILQAEVTIQSNKSRHLGYERPVEAFQHSYLPPGRLAPLAVQP